MVDMTARNNSTGPNGSFESRRALMPSTKATSTAPFTQL
jgi:hypothetical protein